MTSFLSLPDLAAERLGGRAVAANDEFFAAKENLLREAPALWREGEYTDRGKWMDGWETRRRRVPGHDWCIVRLGAPGLVRGVVVDTAHFKGNFPESCSLEACAAPADADPASLAAASWRELVPRSALEGDRANTFAVESDQRHTHVRLNILPDGGVARLRVHGEPLPAWPDLPAELDLASVLLGGRVADCSDRFFGHPHHLLLPDPPQGMFDGWETKRRRGPGHDWVIVRLATEGVIDSVEVDTSHFKGNAPGWFSLDVAAGAGAADADWHEALARRELRPHERQTFAPAASVPAGAARFNIYPDGGVARLRLRGRPTAAGRRRATLAWLDAACAEEARPALAACCAAARWTAQMTAARPFGSAEALQAAADRAFDALSESDWREAFAAHPALGAGAAGEGRGAAWSAGEQSGAAAAGADILARLVHANARYRERFGYTFILCASGRSAAEMLAACEARLLAAPADELRTAAEEQRRITRLRLEKLLGGQR
jgi:allantoicase